MPHSSHDLANMGANMASGIYSNNNLGEFVIKAKAPHPRGIWIVTPARILTDQGTKSQFLTIVPLGQWKGCLASPSPETYHFGDFLVCQAM